MNPSCTRREILHFVAVIGIVGAALMAGCAAPPPEPVTPRSVAPPAPPPLPTPPPAAPAPPPPPDYISSALDPMAYRKDAARHLYGKNGSRVMKGKMPPMLEAVGVLEVDVGPRGEVTRTNWLRAPSHVPEVMREIERTVREAAPFPAPVRMGVVTYTDVWLWHKSGNFQLDTLTEGQN